MKTLSLCTCVVIMSVYILSAADLERDTVLPVVSNGDENAIDAAIHRTTASRIFEKDSENRVWYLEHQITVLGVLIGLACMVGIVAPTVLYIKADRAIRVAFKAKELADDAARRCEELAAKQYVHRGKHHYVQAKNCIAQVRALESIGKRAEEITSGEMASALASLRINFMVQMIVNAERAIAYSFDARYCEGLVADLRKLKECVCLLEQTGQGEELSEVHRRLNDYLWTVSPTSLKVFLRQSKVKKDDRKELLGFYEDVGERYGRFEEDV